MTTPPENNAAAPAPDEVHVPILVDVVLELLNVRPGGRYIDATANGGGHTRAILEASAPDGVVVAFDRDAELVDGLRQKFPAQVADGRLVPVHSSFAHLRDIAEERGFAPVDGILFDLGLSSYHLDKSGRGFAFAREEPLDMRFDATDLDSKLAKELLARAPVDELISIFRELGEERFGSRIARSVVAHRDREPIVTTTDLLNIVEISLPAKTRWRASRHAARVFQGLRIAVNQELETVRAALPEAWETLAPGGRMVVLAFHSLEDRIIKHYFREHRQQGRGRLLTKKPITADADEVERNPRSASAKLRAIEKI